MRCILYLIVYYIYSRHRGGWKGSIDEVTMGPAQHRRCGPSYWQFGAGKRYKSPRSHLAVIRWTVQRAKFRDLRDPNTICSKECSWYMRIARIVLANYIEVESTKKRQIDLIRCALKTKHGKHLWGMQWILNDFDIFDYSRIRSDLLLQIMFCNVATRINPCARPKHLQKFTGDWSNTLQKRHIYFAIVAELHKICTEFAV